MFERFTDQAKRAVMLSQEEARTLGHAYVGTEHLLLGLVGADGGVAHRALDVLDVTPERARDEVETYVGPAEHRPGSHLPFTSSAKGALERAQWEARQLADDRIGTQHLLLALVRPPDTSAVTVLASLDVDPEVLRTAVVQLVEAGARDAETADAGDPDGSAATGRVTRSDGPGGDASAGVTGLSAGRSVGGDDEVDEGVEALAARLRELRGGAERTASAPPDGALSAEVAAEVLATLRQLHDEVSALRAEVARLAQLVEPGRSGRRRF